MFRKLKQFNAARENRRKLLKNLEEIKNEDLFAEVEEVRSEERLIKLASYPGILFVPNELTAKMSQPQFAKKIQVTQVKRYRKRIPVKVGVA